MENNSNKNIARNTVYLYFRMMFTMVVTLFTSRVILQTLGVDDFGTYQTVGGVVAMLSFVNNALATGSSRFLTFELGTKNFDKLKRTFSTVLTVHVLLSLVIVLLAETVGLWFVYNKLTIAPDRMDAAVFTYHLSIVAVVFTITQVPYNASIISHEKMSVYAYASIVDVVLKLGIVYMLYISPFDKLKTYALLYCLISVSMALYYRYYCNKHFLETKFKLSIDKIILKEVLGYSGWNLFANTSIALNNQGATILINMFFSPAVVTARSVANQVNMAACQFVSNFRTAVNPQIVKRYAAGDFESSKELLLDSTKYSFYLMLIMSLPICLEARTLLRVWLGVVPDYSVVFLQLAVVTSLFQVFDTSFYTALYAKGRIRENAMISPMLGFLVFPITCIMFKLGYSPVFLSWTLLVLYATLGLLVKPMLIIKIVGYHWSEIVSVYKSCAIVLLSSIVLPLFYYFYVANHIQSEIWKFLSVVLISVFSVAFATWLFGIPSETKKMIISFVKNKLKQ